MGIVSASIARRRIPPLAWVARAASWNADNIVSCLSDSSGTISITNIGTSMRRHSCTVGRRTMHNLHSGQAAASHFRPTIVFSGGGPVPVSLLRCPERRWHVFNAGTWLHVRTPLFRCYVGGQFPRRADNLNDRRCRGQPPAFVSAQAPGSHVVDRRTGRQPSQFLPEASNPAWPSRVRRSDFQPPDLQFPERPRDGLDRVLRVACHLCVSKRQPALYRIRRHRCRGVHGRAGVF